MTHRKNRELEAKNARLSETHAKVVRLVTDHTLVSDGSLRHQLAQELGVQLQSSYWSSPARNASDLQALRATQDENEKLRAQVTQARTALEVLRPVAAALDAWGHAWLDFNTSPDPDDLPEEAALFEAWKAVGSLKLDGL